MRPPHCLTLLGLLTALLLAECGDISSGKYAKLVFVPFFLSIGLSTNVLINKPCQFVFRFIWDRLDEDASALNNRGTITCLLRVETADRREWFPQIVADKSTTHGLIAD